MKFCLLMSLLGFSTLLLGQNSGGNWRFAETSIMGGLGLQISPQFTDQQLNEMTQNDPWIYQDFDGDQLFGGINLSGSAQFSAYMGFRKEHPVHPVFRVGVNYKRLYSQIFGRYQEWSGPYDTLISSQTGEAFYVDTVRLTVMNGSLGADVLAFDASLMLQTDPTRRWSFYGGIGLQAGILFNQELQLTRMETFSETGMTYEMDVELEQRNYRMNTGFSSTVYLPLGIDFRIGKKRPLWQQVHLVYELRPSLSFQTMSSVSVVSPGVTQHFGLRITI